MEKLPFHVHLLQDPEQFQGGITEEMSAGEETRMGMVLGLSLPPAPCSLPVSLASPICPKKHILKGMLTPQHRLVQKYPSAFVGFYCYTDLCVEVEPVPGMLQQCQPCTKATHLVIWLCEIVTLAKCSFTLEHLLELRHRHWHWGQSHVQPQHRWEQDWQCPCFAAPFPSVSRRDVKA